MTELKNCKKCNRNLPSNYKFKKCESCRNKGIDLTKKVVVGAIGVLGTATLILSGGKNKS